MGNIIINGVSYSKLDALRIQRKKSKELKKEVSKTKDIKTSEDKNFNNIEKK